MATTATSDSVTTFSTTEEYVDTIATSSNEKGEKKASLQKQASFHAHFDCFSGAAGDMMLAACLDASGDPEGLCQYVSDCLSKGIQELAGEFDITTKRVWRGSGSIAGLHVHVHSKYQHAPAPVPKSNHDHDHEDSPSHSHDHSHSHSHIHTSNQEAENSHSLHSSSALHDHSHSSESNQNEHSHDHDHGSEKSSADSKDRSHIHGHNQNNDGDAGSSQSHSHSHSRYSTDSHSHSHSHSHQNSKESPLRNLPEILQMLEKADGQYIDPWVRQMAGAAFTELAKAEAYTHGTTLEKVHFHEVGAIDSIVDTVGTCVALHKLGVETVSCSRLPMGEGTVWTQHGWLPVPAPATLRLLVDMPTCPGPPGVTGELVTPTGAALLKALTTMTQPPNSIGGKKRLAWRPPNFTIRKIGIGAGTKDFLNHPNILRIVLGDTVR